MLRKIKYILSAFLWHFLSIVSLIFGKINLEKSGKLLGLIFYYILPYRKKVVFKNLKLVFPNKNIKELREIAKKTYIFFSTMILEFFYYLENGKSIDINNMDEIKEKICSIYQKYGSFILATGHFGNWELGSIIFNQAKIPISAVYKKLHNEYLDKKIKEIREKYCVENIEMKLLKNMMDSLVSNKRVLLLLIDQDAKNKGEIIDFLNLDTSVYLGPIKIARMTGKPIVTAFIFKDKNNKYSAIINDPVFVKNNLTKDEEIELLEKIHNNLAEMIIKYPDHWLWFHRRWKHLY